MSENQEFEQERTGESDRRRNFEDQCLAELEQESQEEKALAEQELTAAKLLHRFQNSAAAVANLYREGRVGRLDNCMMTPFIHAASTLTNLYKESLEVQKAAFDLGLRIGSHRKVKDVLVWAKKKRRQISKDELVAFVCGRTLPSRQRPSPPRMRATPRPGHGRLSPEFSHGERLPSSESDMTVFQHALAIQGLSGAMSNISVNLHNGTEKSEELNGFSLDEIASYSDIRKRTLNDEGHIDAQICTKRARHL